MRASSVANLDRVATKVCWCWVFWRSHSVLVLMVACTLGCRPAGEPRGGEAPRALPVPAAPQARERQPEQPSTDIPAEPEISLGVADIGVFSDLDAKVQVEIPAEVGPAQASAVIDVERGLLVLYLLEGGDQWPAKVYPLLQSGGRELVLGDRRLRLRPGDHAELGPLLTSPAQISVLTPGSTAPPGDRDRDGIPNPLDIDLGAIKTTLDGALYDQSYVVLDYPGGDVPREIGACTDVIIRALRNAGIDLQVEVHEDIARAPQRYPMVERANSDIDHRRVRTILPWFRAHWTSLEPDSPPRPGDVVFMETIADRKGPDHIGVIGHRRGEDGELLVANSWTDGFRTSFMSLIGHVEITDRFRVGPDPEHRGPIGASTRQLVLVVGDGWNDFHGRAQRFERDAVGEPWRPVGETFEVVLGHGGLAWGRGLHGDGAPAGFEGPHKREGDGRSPAGVFALGRAYGRADAHATALPYTSESATLRCVDDPDSAHYNEVVDAARVDEDWRSAEPMRRYYELAIAVEHNPTDAPEAGSCIFLHEWRDAETAVTGCTAMATAELERLATWLEPGAVLVSLPEALLDELAPAWALPL
jgi:uncharacterized protein YijF (DUF1287 family)